MYCDTLYRINLIFYNPNWIFLTIFVYFKIKILFIALLLHSFFYLTYLWSERFFYVEWCRKIVEKLSNDVEKLSTSRPKTFLETKVMNELRKNCQQNLVKWSSYLEWLKMQYVFIFYNLIFSWFYMYFVAKVSEDY